MTSTSRGSPPDQSDLRQLTVAHTLRSAMKLHETGDFAKAAPLYQQVLRVEPRNADALHLLGVLAHQMGNHNLAIELISGAVTIRPRFFEAHANLGLVLKVAGRFKDAAESYGRAIAIRRKDAALHNGLGNVHREAGEVEAATQSYSRAIALDPRYAPAHNSLGNLLAEKLDIQGAAECYRRATDADPNFVGAWVNLGGVLNELGRRDDAAVAFQKARELEPDNVVAGHMAAALSGETTEAAPAEYVNSFFNTYAGGFEGHLVDRLEYRAPKQMRAAFDALPNTPARLGRALDLGCGTGLVGAEFADIVDAIDGVDLAPAMLKQAEAKGIYAKLHTGDITAFMREAATESTRYDLLLAGDVFIYVGNLDPVFAAAAKVSTTRGYFIFSIEHLESGAYVLQPNARYSQSLGYIETLALRYGFSIQRVDDVTLRLEQDEPVAGHIVVLRRGQFGAR